MKCRRRAKRAVAVVTALVFVSLAMALLLVACGNAGQWAQGASFSSSVANESSLAVRLPSSSAGSAPSYAGQVTSSSVFSLSDVPAYNGQASVQVNGGVPFFSQEDRERAAFEDFAPLDALGRCGPAFATVGRDTMPTEERGSIGMVKPSGWQTTRYDWVDGRYLYNRCHLIGYQLTGENENERNLITGTRSLNTEGMLPYEDQVATYVRSTGNHVLYRSTPVFEGDELVARGVLLEALSVEDDGAGVRLCAWCYNVEPGVEIDYATGESRVANASDESTAFAGAHNAGGTPFSAKDAASGVSRGGAPPASGETANAQDEVRDEGGAPSADGTVQPTSGAGPSEGSGISEPVDSEVRSYVLNTNTHKFHYPNCSSVEDMADRNKQFVEATREEVIANGYQPCRRCNP